MRSVLLGIALSALVLVAAASSAVGSQSPRSYLDHALTLMRTTAVVRPKEGWPVVIRKAERMAAHARTRADTYGAIIYALDQLYQAGDVHAVFANSLTAKLETKAATIVGTTTTPPPTVSTLDGRIGVIVVPAIAQPTPPNSRHYIASALSAIASVQAASAPCGWIVDLRQNSGGDMYPMLLSLGPILGNGTLVGFTGRSGFDGYATYNDGVISIGRDSVRAPVAVPTFSPLPPVAVLTGPGTLSSGEAVTIAFRGRSDTQSFGAPTGGAPTSPHPYRLADGATIAFSTADDVDRDGVIYTGPIQPDQPTAAHLPASATEAAAQQWLLTTPACNASGGHS